MEFLFSFTYPSAPTNNRPEYLLKVGRRLIPVTRDSLERLGMLRPATPAQRPE